MITLYTFGSYFGLPDPSPFVMKAEVLLKMSGLPFQTDATTGFQNAPKGKLPAILDAGELLGDSTLIRWHLEKKYHIDFDPQLSNEQKAIAWAIEKLLEEHLNWAIVDCRWMDDANFEKGPALFFSKLPSSQQAQVKEQMRQKIKADLIAQGFGLLSHSELRAIVAKAIQSVAVILGDKPYLMGAEPCGADATCFAFLANALCPIFDTYIHAEIKQYSPLVDYVSRMNQRYYA